MAQTVVYLPNKHKTLRVQTLVPHQNQKKKKREREKIWVTVENLGGDNSAKGQTEEYVVYEVCLVIIK
jgi:hypothetical protein